MRKRRAPIIAKVIVDVRTRSLAEPFDYDVPEELGASMAVGVPVLVPLGSRVAVGHVVEVVATSSVAGRKPIAAVLGPSRFDANAWRLARWIADEYACPLAEALRLMLPPGGAPTVERVATEKAVTWHLRAPAVVAVEDRIVELVVADPVLTPNASLQRSVVEALRAGPVSMSELSADLGSVRAAVKSLESRGIVHVTARRRWRTTAVGGNGTEEPHALTAAQSAAVTAIAEGGPGEVFLLEGVTGSGKTEVYLAAIRRVLDDGGGAIVLVPEISLTPQAVGRFRRRFGSLVAVLHSRLSAGERYDQWELVESGEARVVVGARSALFAPVHNLQLIVIDEEHEPSYKQGSAPRYHARDVAVELARLRGARLVLGSATPSMEAHHAVRLSEWRRLALPERVGRARMPAITVVDMGAEFQAGNRSVFSGELTRALDEVLRSGTRAVLFLNRRGFASFLLCRECGFVPQCPSCSVSLTYHERADRLVCHHCGHDDGVPQVCPRCKSPYLRRFGAGTERIEQELRSRWPGLAVTRMDADTTRGKGGHEKALARFEADRPSVLLGTQMIAKGLDYPDVTLVGVLSADTSLRLPDFRSAERTFQLLEQVSGRAGRSSVPGRVIVQSYWPDHPAVRALADRQPSLLYVPEEAERAALGYPPYTRLANITCSGPTRAAVVTAAESLAAVLSSRLPDGWMLLGPADPVIVRLKGLHRRHVLLKAPRGAALGAYILRSLAVARLPQGVSVATDVDPVDLM